ncbi:MAG: DUF885 domain-containing protein [Steroidobacteraceae bacterium]
MKDSIRAPRAALFLRPATALAVALAATVASAGVGAAGAAPAPRGAAAKLDALYEAYFEDELKLRPTHASYIGDERYNDRLENSASPEFEAAAVAIERRYLQRAKAIDARGLAPSARVSREIFVRERELALEGLRFPARLLPIDQMGSMASEFAVLGSGAGAQPFRDGKDYENFLSRARDFAAWADSAIVAMREGVARGVVQPRIVVERVLPQLRELAAAARDPEKSLFWQPVASMPATIPVADRERLVARYREAIVQQIAPAYARLADYLESEYLAHARSSVGWSALPNGADWYRYRVRTQTTTNLAADEIHALGLGEVARIRGEMDAVMRQVGFQGSLREFFRYVQADDRFYYTRAEDLVAAYLELKKRIDARLPTMFSDFPRADYEVRPVEAFRAASSPGAFYQGPSADGRRPGIFYVNTYNLRAQPKYGMETLSLHEASPGHHFQVSIQQELTDLPKFRRFNDYVAYSEGWALYCESIGKELGMFTDPWQWYGRLSDEMLRAMRLVVDTGLHAKGWSREQAIAYMQDNSSMADSDIVAEVERYIVWPGQALGYKVGQLRITALRARAQQELGARFDVKEFHSQVLRDGAVPMDVLEAKIGRWIAEKKKRAR